MAQHGEARRIQTVVSGEVHAGLTAIAHDTGRSIADLALDSFLLLLRFHDCGDGLPSPLTPAGITIADAKPCRPTTV